MEVISVLQDRVTKSIAEKRLFKGCERRFSKAVMQADSPTQACAKDSMSARKIRMELLNIELPKDFRDVSFAVRSLQVITSLCRDEKLCLAELHATCARLLEKSKEISAGLEVTSGYSDYARRLQDEISKVVDVLRTNATLRHGGEAMCWKDAADSAFLNANAARNGLTSAVECWSANDAANAPADLVLRSLSEILGTRSRDYNREQADDAVLHVRSISDASTSDVVEEIEAEHEHDENSMGAVLANHCEPQNSFLAPIAPEEQSSARRPSYLSLKRFTKMSSLSSTSDNELKATESGASDEAKFHVEQDYDSESESLEQDPSKRLTLCPPTSPATSPSMNPRLKHARHLRDEDKSLPQVIVARSPAVSRSPQQASAKRRSLNALPPLSPGSLRQSSGGDFAAYVTKQNLAKIQGASPRASSGCVVRSPNGHIGMLVGRL